MKKIYTFYYYLNDFDIIKENIIDLRDNFEDSDEHKDIFKALDDCKVSPRKKVLDKIFEFSKLK